MSVLVPLACSDGTTNLGDGAAGANAAGSSSASPVGGAGSEATAGGASSTPAEADAGNGGAVLGEADGGSGGRPQVEEPGGQAGADAAGATGSAGSGASNLAIAIAGELSSLTVSELTLTPSFSPAIHDYYVRCAAGSNALTFQTSDDNGPHSVALSLVPDQAVVVAETYWLRCLPPDFPTITVTRPGAPTPGYYLLNSALYGVVLDVNGVPVWYARGQAPIGVDSPAENTISFMRDMNLSSAFFEIHALDTGVVSQVRSPNGPTDPHELRVLPNGDFLVFTTPVQAGIDLTGLGSYNSTNTLLGCAIEELDASGSVVWSWLASDHVDPVLESLNQINTTVNGVPVVDAYHCNGIDVDAAGNLLVSMRHTNSAFYVERATGHVAWKLGGSEYNKDGAALVRIHNDTQTAFSLQHDARFQANGDVTLFDDHGMGTGVARGIEYALDFEANTATPVFQFLGSGPAMYEGSFRRYADGDSVISWGYIPSDQRVLTEVDAAGNDVFDLAFSVGNVSYRGVKVPLSQFDIDLLRRNVAH